MRRERVRSRQNDAGVASKYIGDVSELKHGDFVFLWCRVSGRTQKKKGNLNDAEANLRREMAKRGVIVLKAVKECTPGYDSSVFYSLADQACRAGAKLVAESTDRFIRSSSYHSSKRPNLTPSVMDFEVLRLATKGARLITVLHADATPNEIRSYQRKRGQREKNAKGGQGKLSEQEQLLKGVWEAFRQLPP